MPDYFIFVLIGSLLLIFLAVFFWNRRRERERREAFERLSHTMGFVYAKEAGLETIAGFALLQLFDKGRRKKISNLLRRSEGDRERLFFDYQFTVGGGKNSNTARQSVAAYQLDRDLPTFELRPEHLFHKIGSKLGYQDIDFDSSPEFSRRYLLRGQDEQAIRSVFGPSARHFLEQNLGWSVEGGGPWIVFYRQSKRIPPGELSSFLATGENAVRTLTGR